MLSSRDHPSAHVGHTLIDHLRQRVHDAFGLNPRETFILEPVDEGMGVEMEGLVEEGRVEGPGRRSGGTAEDCGRHGCWEHPHPSPLTYTNGLDSSTINPKEPTTKEHASVDQEALVRRFRRSFYRSHRGYQLGDGQLYKH